MGVMEVEKLSPKQLRQRLFAKQSSVLYEQSNYTFDDLVPDVIEKLEKFDSWESFSKVWDILWVGLDPRTLKWEAGRHHSPLRKIVTPLRIVMLDDRTKRMMLVPEDREDIDKLEVPFKEPLPETEEDRAISASLSGKVVVDEPDEDKARRLLEENIKELAAQLALLTQMAENLK